MNPSPSASAPGIGARASGGQWLALTKPFPDIHRGAASFCSNPEQVHLHFEGTWTIENDR